MLERLKRYMRQLFCEHRWRFLFASRYSQVFICDECGKVKTKAQPEFKKEPPKCPLCGEMMFEYNRSSIFYCSSKTCPLRDKRLDTAEKSSTGGVEVFLGGDSAPLFIQRVCLTCKAKWPYALEEENLILDEDGVADANVCPRCGEPWRPLTMEEQNA